jgi:hypothetical protein
MPSWLGFWRPKLPGDDPYHVAHVIVNSIRRDREAFVEPPFRQYGDRRPAAQLSLRQNNSRRRQYEHTDKDRNREGCGEHHDLHTI